MINARDDTRIGSEECRRIVCDIKRIQEENEVEEINHSSCF
jgi:hypothetical protein